VIQTDESTISYAGNNSIVSPYPVNFYFFVDEDLVVVVKDSAGLEDPQILNTDYTVTGEGDPNGGNVLFTWPVPATSRVTIFRDVPATQLTSYQEGDAFPAASHEKALDKLTMLIQQALRVTGGGGPTDLGRAFRLSEASAGINAVAKLNDSTLGLDALGNAILRTASDMLGWMGQYGTAWENTSERLQTSAAYTGQVGVQIDNGAIYIANSTTPGDWFPFLIGSGIVGATDGVPHLLMPPAGDLVGTDQAQTLYNKTLESPTIHTPTGLTKNDVGLSQVDNTSDLNKPLSSATGAALAFKQDKSEKAISNGYPSLDGAGKIPIAQIPDAVVGASQYQGTWDAATNTPTIPTAATGNKGWYYAVSVAGTTNINGINSWAVGDQIISNGTVWQKIVNVSAVSSVNSKTGAVVLVPADLNLGNVDNTSDATKNSATATLTNKTINGANNTLIVRLDVDVINNLPVNRLNNGTGAGPTTWWCGDNSWKQPPGTGDVNGPGGSGDGEVALYSGTTGKIIRRYSGPTGVGHFTATGVFSATPIMATDLDPDVISGLPVATDIGAKDQIIILEEATGLLKRTTGDRVNRLPRNYLFGCILSNNVADTANDIDIAAGSCRDSTDVADIIVPALTKRLDAAWAAGTNQGGRDTGVISDATWHVFAIRNPTTTVSDVLFSQSPASPTMPPGFTQKRRIASIIRRGAGGIIPFRQIGDYFQVVNPVLDFTAGWAAGTYGGGSILNIPSGLKFYGHFAVSVSNSVGASGNVVRDPDQANLTNATINTQVANVIMSTVINNWTDSNKGLFFYVASGSGTSTFYVTTLGWFDYRGKND
jgi:hypothetical protein